MTTRCGSGCSALWPPGCSRSLANRVYVSPRAHKSLQCPLRLTKWTDATRPANDQPRVRPDQSSGVSAEAGTKHGFLPSVGDELAQARSRELYDVLDKSFGAREEPLFITISEQFERTAAVGLRWGAIEQKQSICRNEPLMVCRNGAPEIR